MLFLLAGCGFSSAFGQTDVTIQNKTYASGETATVVASGTITASTAVTLDGGATITYVAGTRVTLGDGFHASTGSTLRVMAGDSDGDGIPDTWEIANGLNPSSASDASQVQFPISSQGDGLTNLQKFLLGLSLTSSAPPDTSNTTALRIHRPTN